VAAGVLLHYCLVSTFCWMLCEGYQLYLDFVVVISAESRLWQMLAFSVLVPAAFVAGDLAEALGVDSKTAFLWTFSCIPFEICAASFAWLTDCFILGSLDFFLGGDAEVISSVQSVEG
jgi:hypothetical protein